MVAELAPSYTRVVELVAARVYDTIEALHAKSDIEVGVEALTGVHHRRGPRRDG